jgi:hypothetical protein
MPKRGKTDWLAGFLYPAAVLLMEAFWVFPWLSWLGGWPMYAVQRPPLSLAAVIVVLAASLAVTRFLNRRDNWSLTAIRLAVVGSGAVVFLAVLRVSYPPPAGTGWFTHVGNLLGNTLRTPSTFVLAIPALIFLWWRGIVMARRTASFRDVYRSFIPGMAALIVLIIVWQVSSSNDRFVKLGSDVGLYVIAFFFFGLLAIAIGHLYNIRRTMPKDGSAVTSVRRWLPIMLGVVGGMVLISFGVAAIFTPGFFGWVGRAATAVGSGLGKVIDIILIPLGWIFDAIFWLVRWFVSLLRKLSPDAPPQNTDNGTPPFQNVIPKELPPELLLFLKWALFIIVAGLIIYFLARAVRRARSGARQEDIEEINESLFSWKGLRDDLKGLFNNWRHRFAVRHGPRRARPGDDLSGTLDVREIYRRLLWESGQSGLPRRPGETVEEYAARMGRLVPDSAAPLDGLNPSYSEVRYGEHRLDDDRVRSANRLWATVRGVLRGLRGKNNEADQ